MRVGVLALQGGFDAHARAVAALGHAPTLVRSTRDLRGAEALVLPGGESSVMLDLLDRDRALEDALVDLADGGAPVLATCAGLILIARRVHDPAQRSLSLLDVEVRRNARGRQVHSSEALDDAGRLTLLSIRAPRIVACGPDVEVLATLDGEPVLVREGRVVGATFHPELTHDLSVHALALDLDRSGPQSGPDTTVSAAPGRHSGGDQRSLASTSEGPRGSSSTSGPSNAEIKRSGAASASR